MAFAFNKQAAGLAGASSYIQQGGAYICTVTDCEDKSSASGGQAAWFEFTLNAAEGQANWVKVFYQGKDGGINDRGYNMLNAIFDLVAIGKGKTIPEGAEVKASHLKGQQIGLVLQKVLTSKQDGSDSYEFQILQAFDPKSGKTSGEISGGKDAKEVASIVASLTERDARKKGQQQRQQSWGQPQGATSQQNLTEVPPAFDDEIPF